MVWSNIPFSYTHSYARPTNHERSHLLTPTPPPPLLHPNERQRYKQANVSFRFHLTSEGEDESDSRKYQSMLILMCVGLGKWNNKLSYTFKYSSPST